MLVRNIKIKMLWLMKPLTSVLMTSNAWKFILSPEKNIPLNYKSGSTMLILCLETNPLSSR